jgi:hypothetical protein
MVSPDCPAYGVDDRFANFILIASPGPLVPGMPADAIPLPHARAPRLGSSPSPPYESQTSPHASARTSTRIACPSGSPSCHEISIEIAPDALRLRCAHAKRARVSFSRPLCRQLATFFTDRIPLPVLPLHLAQRAGGVASLLVMDHAMRQHPAVSLSYSITYLPAGKGPAGLVIPRSPAQTSATRSSAVACA